MNTRGQTAASLAAALLGGQPLVSLLGDGQTDSLSSGHGHPWLVALETNRKEDIKNRRKQCEDDTISIPPPRIQSTIIVSEVKDSSYRLLLVLWL